MAHRGKKHESKERCPLYSCVQSDCIDVYGMSMFLPDWVMFFETHRLTQELLSCIGISEVLACVPVVQLPSATV